MSAIGEPRGPRHKFAGLCDRCGLTTIRTAADGKPRHEGCDIGGHQITTDEAIAELARVGLIPDPDDW